MSLQITLNNINIRENPSASESAGLPSLWADAFSLLAAGPRAALVSVALALGQTLPERNQVYGENVSFLSFFWFREVWLGADMSPWASQLGPLIIA